MHRRADPHLIRQTFSPTVPPFVEAREELLASIVRWRAMIHAGQLGTEGTLLLGVAMRAITLAEVLLRQAVAVVAPPAEIPAKPTFGDLRQVLERHGRRAKMTCLGRSRGLITDTDLRVIDRVVKARNEVAHVAEPHIVDPRSAGHQTPDAVLDLLDRVEELARLPLFDEIACREERERNRRLEQPEP